jgi:hypothetical protein
MDPGVQYNPEAQRIVAADLVQSKVIAPELPEINSSLLADRRLTAPTYCRHASLTVKYFLLHLVFG